MKLQSIEAIPLRLPFREVFRIARGAVGSPEAGAPHIYVRVTADDGAEGGAAIGENQSACGGLGHEERAGGVVGFDFGGDFADDGDELGGFGEDVDGGEVGFARLRAQCGFGGAAGSVAPPEEGAGRSGWCGRGFFF